MHIAIATFLALAIATPASAQQAYRTMSPYAEISGVIRGTTLESITTMSGPAGGRQYRDPTAKGFTFASGAAILYYYRVGASVAGKHWDDPGTVAAEDAGFIVSWPNALIGGAPAPDIVAELSIGDLTYRHHILRDAKETQAAALFLQLDSRLQAPAQKHDVVAIKEADRQLWRDAFIKTTSVRTDLYDASGKQYIATMNYSLLDRASMQQRFIVNVNTLGKAVADGTCK